jgi:hypothetical protein
VTGLAVSFTAPARAYLVTLVAAVTNTNAGSYGQLALEESVNGGTTWTPLGYQVSRAPQGSTSLTLMLTRQRNPGGGTAVQYRATLNAAAGGSAVVVVDSNSALPTSRACTRPWPARSRGT